MKKTLMLLLLTTFLFAFNTDKLIQNIIGRQKFQTYKGLIHTLIKNKNVSLTEIITILKENGLINLFFNKPRLIHPSFTFYGNNPIFETKILYMTLENLGYYYFYPYKVEKNSKYNITLELKSVHYIDPQNFINEIKTYGCQVVSLKKENGNFHYLINCKNAKLNVPLVTSKLKGYTKAKGIYWFDVNGFKKIYIATSKYDNWYPYVVLYDKHLHILEIIKKKTHQRVINISVPSLCKYIKIRDNYTKENFKRGIFIKGIK